MTDPKNTPEKPELVDFSSTSDKRVGNNSTRLKYRVLTDLEKAQVDGIKTLGATMISLLHNIGDTDPAHERFASRDLSLANTHIEDAVMRVVRHITK